MATAESKKLFLLGLEKFVEWCNQNWKESMDEEGTYTIESFTVNNPKKDLYGGFKILSSKEAGNADMVLHAIVYDGDEGGNHDLIMGFSESFGPGKGQSRFSVQFIMHGFDGGWHMIFNEGEFIHE